MRKCIVTTTINSPTEALNKFATKLDWDLIIVGDKKTPHNTYDNFVDNKRIFYIHPDTQEKKYQKLSELIGWNCIQRRNIGLIEAYISGYKVIATVDDDNIPYDNWGEELLIGKECLVKCYKTKQEVFDPLSVTNRKSLWHRGFPIQLLKNKNDKKELLSINMKVLVQADLWDGEADVDAVERLTLKTNGYLRISTPYTSDKISPFNSQNTFLDREVIPNYFLFPHVGRLDDIWASYYVQSKHGLCVVYNKPSVFQERNVHDISKDIENEVLGYKHSLEVVRSLPYIEKFLPHKSILAFNEYQRLLRDLNDAV
jgi:hypothetical protein